MAEPAVLPPHVKPKPVYGQHPVIGLFPADAPYTPAFWDKLPLTDPKWMQLYTWQMSANGDHCQECTLLDGETCTLAEWKNSGLIPPIHPNCQCILVPYQTGMLSMENPQSSSNPQSRWPVLRPEISNHQCFEISGSPTPGGSFEILAITAGTGNGWEFSEACLSASLALWANVECFIDHEWEGHSLKDLAGVCHDPQWDSQAKGIRTQLKTVGPSAPLLTELGKQMLAEGEPHPRVGFSADVIFTSEGKKVKNILRVLSVDLVFNPARGGAFLPTPL